MLKGYGKEFMKDLIKAQLYQILRSKPFYYIIFGIMAFQGLDIIGSINGDGITSISMYIVQYCGTVFTTSAIAACLVAVYIVGGDINDKTANYEILSGHTRREIFIAKAVLGVICGSIAYVLTIIIPICIGNMVVGYGDMVSIDDICVRVALSTLVTIRIICAFICLTYIIKNYLITMAVSVFYFMVLPVLCMYMEGANSLILGLTSYNKLSDLVSWMTYTIDANVNIQEIIIYDASVSANVIIGVIASSVIATIIALIIGYSFFKRDDIR